MHDGSYKRDRALNLNIFVSEQNKTKAITNKTRTQ